MPTLTAKRLDGLWSTLEQGDPAGVVAELDAAGEHLSPAARVLHGLALYSAGRPVESVEVLRGVLVANAENPVAQLYLVLALYATGQRRRAGEALAAATVLPHPGWLREFVRVFWPLRFRGALGAPLPVPSAPQPDPFARDFASWQGSGDPPPANPRLAHRYELRAEAEFLAGRRPVAYALMARAHSIDPASSSILTNHAFIGLVLNRRDEAFRALHASMSARTEFPAQLPPAELVVVYAWALHELGRHEEALEFLAQMAPEGPEDLGAHFYAAVCWLMLGRDEEFRRAFAIATSAYFIDTWEQLLQPFIGQVREWLLAGESPDAGA